MSIGSLTRQAQGDARTAALPCKRGDCRQPRPVSQPQCCEPTAAHNSAQLSYGFPAGCSWAIDVPRQAAHAQRRTGCQDSCTDPRGAELMTARKRQSPAQSPALSLHCPAAAHGTYGITLVSGSLPLPEMAGLQATVASQLTHCMLSSSCLTSRRLRAAHRPAASCCSS